MLDIIKEDHVDGARYKLCYDNMTCYINPAAIQVNSEYPAFSIIDSNSVYMEVDYKYKEYRMEIGYICLSILCMGNIKIKYKIPGEYTDYRIFIDKIIYIDEIENNSDLKNKSIFSFISFKKTKN